MPGEGHDFDFEPPRAMEARNSRSLTRYYGLISYAAGVVAVTYAAKSSTLNISAFLLDRPETRSNLMWMLPLGVATFLPLGLSALTWWLICTSRATWRLHLVFVPAAIVLFVGGIRSFLHMTRAIGVPIDGMKEADAIALGGAYLVLSLFVHFTALSAIGIAGLCRRLRSA